MFHKMDNNSQNICEHFIKLWNSKRCIGRKFSISWWGRNEKKMVAYMRTFDSCFVYRVKTLRYGNDLERASVVRYLGNKFLQSPRWDSFQVVWGKRWKAKQMKIDNFILPRQHRIPRTLNDGTAAPVFLSCADIYRKDFNKALHLF